MIANLVTTWYNIKVRFCRYDISTFKSFDSYALLTIVKFKLKLGYLKMELKLEKCSQK
jgi:hypothetical protein